MEYVVYITVRAPLVCYVRPVPCDLPSYPQTANIIHNCVEKT
jgi:hypothetical protein